jgi:hypothetical protein
MFFDTLLQFIATALVVLSMLLGCLVLLLITPPAPRRRRTRHNWRYPGGPRG